MSENLETKISKLLKYGKTQLQNKGITSEVNSIRETLDKIAEIETEPNVYSTTVEINQNGKTTITPEDSADGFDKVEIVTNIEGYKVTQTIDGDYCTLKLTSLSNSESGDSGGENTPSVEAIPELPAVLEYLYSETNVEFMGLPYYELKSSLIISNMEGNTKVMFNIYADGAGDVDMGDPEHIKNSIFICTNWESVTQESGGYRIFFTDDNYGRFNVLLDPSNLTNVAVYLDDGVTADVSSPVLTLYDQLDSLDGYELYHEYESDDSYINFATDYINQKVYLDVYVGDNTYHTTGAIEYDSDGKAYYVINPTEDGKIGAVTYTTMLEDYQLFPQINEITVSPYNMTRVMYSKNLYLTEVSE